MLQNGGKLHNTELRRAATLCCVPAVELQWNTAVYGGAEVQRRGAARGCGGAKVNLRGAAH